MDSKNGGKTNIQKKQDQFNQNYNYNINNIPNYNDNKQPSNKEIYNNTYINQSNSKQKLTNIDNNIDQNTQETNNNSYFPKVEDKQINEIKNKNPLNPKRENKAKKGIKKDNKELNNNKKNKSNDFDASLTPQGDDAQDIRNYYKYIKNEYADNTNTINNNPSTKIENKKEKEVDENMNSFSFNEYKKASLVAIENIGNSSYMSAIIRILANNKHIAKYYLTKLNNINNYLQEIPLSYAFSRIIFHLYPFPQDSLKKSISLDNFYRTVLLLNPIFKGTSTKNAIEFLDYLLETLHNENKFFRIKNNNENSHNEMQKQDFKEYALYLDKNEKSIIYDNFGWIMQEIKKCTVCEEEKITYQYFFTYDVNILNSLESIVMEGKKKDINIFDCITQQSKKKKIFSHYCFKCKNKTIFEEEKSIYTSPKYFIFLIGIKEDKAINKIKESNIKIRIDKKLNLEGIIKGPQEKYVYEPIGKVDYCFKSKEYITSCRDFIEKQWYKYENNKYNISKIDLSEVYNSYDILPTIVVYAIKKNQ